MDHYRRDLVRNLFATVTAMLEDAQPLAVRGQSPRRTSAQYVLLARRIKKTASDIGVVVESIAITTQCLETRTSKRKMPRS